MTKLDRCRTELRFPTGDFDAFKLKCVAANVSMNQALLCLAKLVVRGDVVMQAVGAQADLLARPGSIINIPQRKKMLRVRNRHPVPKTKKPVVNVNGKSDV